MPDDISSGRGTSAGDVHQHNDDFGVRSNGTVGRYFSTDVPAIYRIEQNLHYIPPEKGNQLRYQLEQMASDNVAWDLTRDKPRLSDSSAVEKQSMPSASTSYPGGPAPIGINPFTHVGRQSSTSRAPRDNRPAPLGDYVSNSAYSSVGSGKVNCADCGKNMWRWESDGTQSGEM